MIETRTDLPDPLAAALLPLRALFEHTSETLALYDLCGQLCYINPSLERALARARTEVQGLPAGTLHLRPDDALRVAEAVRATLDDGQDRTLVTAPDGDGRCQLHVSALRDGSGGIVGAAARGRDATVQHAAEQALHEHQTLVSALLDQAPFPIIGCDRQGHVRFLNPAAAAHAGVEAAGTIGRRPGEVPTLQPLAAHEPALLRVLATGTADTLDCTCPGADGRLRHLRLHLAPIGGVDGAPQGVLAFGLEVTDLRQALQQLATAEAEFRSLAENAPDYIARFDRDGRFTYLNRRLREFLAMPQEQLLGRRPDEARPGGALVLLRQALKRAVAQVETVDLELPVRLPQGRTGTHAMRLMPECDADGRVTGVLAVGRDVTAQKQQAERIEALAFRDVLTGLLNRTGMRERLDALVGAGTPFALLLLDLDHFKDVNDSRGHDEGDRLLREVGLRLQAAAERWPGAALARYGGDEFVVALPQPGRHAAEALAEDILTRLAEPLALSGGGHLPSSCSIGIASFPDDATAIDTLLSQADSAMYEAKRRGRGTWHRHSAELSARLQHKMLLRQALGQALADEALSVMCQPQLSLADGRLTGVELLLRWRHPQLGDVPPEQFVPLAEESGLIRPIGDWVLAQACQLAARWNPGRAEPVVVAVNVSPRQFNDFDLAGRVAELLAASGCRAEWLQIEITEGLMIDDPEAVQAALQALSALGVSIAIDDFGAGHSALGYLQRFAVDVLKIDRRFVQPVLDGERHAALLQAFVSLGRALGLATVAEGVECAEQAELLARLGCAQGQGFHFGLPMPPAAFESRHLGCAG